VESPSSTVDDERVTAPSARPRASTHRRFRLAVVVASVGAAVAGSILLATHRSSERVSARTGSILAAALPPGGKVVARIRVGRAGLPLRGGGALAVGEGAVWAMSNSQATLMRIDPARNAVVAKIKIAPPEAAAAGDGAVWLSDPSENTVSRVDPATNRVTATIHVGPQPKGIAVSPGAVWVALTNGDRIVRVDPATNRVVATARLGYQPCGFLAADETGVWSTGGHCGDVVTRVDARTNRRITNLGEVFPAGIQVAFGSVWVATDAGNVDQLDPRSGWLVARLHIVGEPERLGVGFGSVWINDVYGRVLRVKPQRVAP